MIDKGSWKANGKLLITGEYLVMESAKAFAIPLKLGQSLEVEPNNEGIINWESYHNNGSWFNASFQLPFPDLIETNNRELALKLENILKEAFVIVGDPCINGVNIRTVLDFDPEYGMGSSSTLISNISNWLDIDPFALLENTFGGSGYDVACARNDQPLFFQIENERNQIIPVEFAPPFLDNIYFVYLNKKQSSSNSIADFKRSGRFNSSDIKRVSEISNGIVNAGTLNAFEDLLKEHEEIISNIIGMPKIKDVAFKDFPGAVKSLGAWGGDFVMMTNHESHVDFVKRLSNKGYKTVFRYNQIAK